ncbi:sugar ABC transporter substrate-binding protein [Arthrobacter sp. HY1533]|uniref:sugar ABC transporter substrate-binding protein n=1 Tax=Arthrobacter sp. HY1533 TaxID=2970919 RepID=UPI0022B9DBCE|nr:extracellular solute-binding protein [Arthrobacter sp. HY1533]
MKKRFALALPVAAALILGLGACSPGNGGGSAGGDAAGKPEILVWVDATREPAAKTYKAAVEGKVDVKIEVIDPTTLISKIQLFNTTKKGWPDVVFSGAPNDFATWADPANGYAAPLNETVSKEVQDGYGTANDWCKIDGKIYCLKNDLAQNVLWYDTKTFKELGLTVPKTMEEFASTAMKLKGTGYIAGTVANNALFNGFLWPAGCSMADVVDSGTIRIAPGSKECTEVTDLLQPLVDAGVMETQDPFDAGFLKKYPQAGKVAMTVGPSWFGEFVFKPADSWGIPEGRMTAAEMPKWAGQDKAYSGEWGGGVWVASSHAKFPQAAADAVSFLATDDSIQKDAVTYPAYGPALKVWKEKISADKYYAADPIPAMAAQAERISPAVKPVRFNADGAVTSVLSTQVIGGAKLATAVTDFQKNMAQLAEASGYKVVAK